MSRNDFGRLPDGTGVSIWTLTNGHGMRVRVMDYGASIVSIEVPDRSGEPADVVLGFDALEAYLTHSGCLGAVVGRYANRIAYGRFELDGRVYQLPLRGGVHHLHGGPEGFDRRVWSGEWGGEGRSVRFFRRSAAGEEGYPGTCDVTVTYTLTERNALVVDYEARTDAPTPINLSQHSYFNLAGHDAGDIGGHEVRLAAGHFTPVDKVLIPTGEIRPVAGTALDFTVATPVGQRIDAPEDQLQRAGGYDHNFVIDREPGSGLVLAAHVRDPRSGRTLEVRTTEPGVQFYTGNFLDGRQVGKGGHAYARRAGFCLETQHYPDSPNHPSFPSTILRPGGRFQSRTMFIFGTDAQGQA